MGWRDKYKVHPAADVFPMMSDDELAKLGEDIKANGLLEPVTFSYPPSGATLVEAIGELLDGRNRLEAMERAGIEIHLCGMSTTLAREVDPVAFIIGKNIHRRHLSKQQQADLIVAAHKASRQDGEVPKRHVKGKAGSSKDESKAAIVASAAEHGISKRTVERAIAKSEGKTPKAKSDDDADRMAEIAKGKYLTLDGPMSDKQYQKYDKRRQGPGSYMVEAITLDARCFRNGVTLGTREEAEAYIEFHVRYEVEGFAVASIIQCDDAPNCDIARKSRGGRVTLFHAEGECFLLGWRETGQPPANESVEAVRSTAKAWADLAAKVAASKRAVSERPCKRCGGSGRITGKTGTSYDCDCVRGEAA
jgi:hypothetical protein